MAPGLCAPLHYSHVKAHEDDEMFVTQIHRKSHTSALHNDKTITMSLKYSPITHTYQQMMDDDDKGIP
jgi:hypothetical protein